MPITHPVVLAQPVVLAESGIGYRQHRIPALAGTGRGTLVAAYDGRPDLDDLPGPIDLVMRRSTDGGTTWSDPVPARSAVGLTGHGDASLLADDARPGRLLCFHATGTAVGFFECGDGMSDDDPDLLHTDLLISDDEGVTWRPRRLTAALRRQINAGLDGGRVVAGLFAASGAGTQLRAGPHAGRLLQGLVALVRGAAGPEMYAVVARSDDGGQTWATSPVIGPGANESALAGLPDGRVLLHVRAPGRRLAAWSSDGGATFSPLARVEGLLDPGNNGSLAVLPGGTLVASHTADPDLRRRLVLSRSDDAGATWRAAVTLSSSGAGYSVIQPLPDGSLGVLWEDEGYRRLLFTRVRLDAPAPTPIPAPAPGSSPVSDAPLAVDPALVLDHVVPARPALWRGVGDSRAVPLAPEQYDAAVFKIVGGENGVQRVATREAYAVNLGPPHPGLAPGDVLVCSARLPLDRRVPAVGVASRWPVGTEPAVPCAGGTAPAVRWAGAPHPATVVVDADGARLLARGLRYVVSAADVADGTVRLRVDSDSPTTAVGVPGAAGGTDAAILDVPIRPGATPTPQPWKPPHRPAPPESSTNTSVPGRSRGFTPKTGRNGEPCTP